jgi:hypothetical protein
MSVPVLELELWNNWEDLQYRARLRVLFATNINNALFLQFARLVAYNYVVPIAGG